MARVAQRKKGPTNSDFKICYGDIKVIQNCKKQKNHKAILEIAVNTHTVGWGAWADDF